MIHSHGWAGSCDQIEPDFEKTVNRVLARGPSAKSQFLIFEGEVLEVKKVFPLKTPTEMTVKISKMIFGKWEPKTLTAKWTGSSAVQTFEHYKVGVQYRMAFLHSIEDGQDYFSQSICGTYHQELKNESKVK